ncbi:hypothetical protein [Moorena producens]|nr:hypothetical protein [Moorena producens]
MGRWGDAYKGRFFTKGRVGTFIVSHAKREWGKPRQLLGERQSLMVRSYRKTGSPCQPCKARVGETTAVAHGLFAFAFGVAYGQAWPTAKLP